MAEVEERQLTAGSEINFFRQAPAGDGNFFFSRHMEKCGRQKVSIKFFLRSETQTNIFGSQMENSARQFFFLESERRERIWGRNDGDVSANDEITYKHSDYL